jgi:hypothetical protein
MQQHSLSGQQRQQRQQTQLQWVHLGLQLLQEVHPVRAVAAAVVAAVSLHSTLMQVARSIASSSTSMHLTSLTTRSSQVQQAWTRHQAMQQQRLAAANRTSSGHLWPPHHLPAMLLLWLLWQQHKGSCRHSCLASAPVFIQWPPAAIAAQVQALREQGMLPLPQRQALLWSAATVEGLWQHWRTAQASGGGEQVPVCMQPA